MTRVKHKQVYRPNAFGGVTNTTMCGRVREGNDMNVADTDEQVTCKFCMRRMETRRNVDKVINGLAAAFRALADV